MKTHVFSINPKSSMGLSAVLHAGLLALAFLIAVPEVSLPPLGVELMMGSEDGVKSAQPQKVEKIQAPQAVVDTSSEGPAIKEEKTTTVAQPVATSQAAGSSAGTSDKGATAGREGVANGNAEASPEERYLYELKKLLERRKRYPMMAKKMGQSGKVTMRFTLSADGSLTAAEVVEKSQYESLNQAAIDLVKGIDGMKPFPKEIDRSSWSITVPIEYHLN